MTLQQALQAALADHETGNAAEAESILNQILAQHPDQPEALHLLGFILLHRGKPREAYDLLSRAALANPNVADFQAHLGVALAQLGRFNEAVDHWQKTVALRPADSQTWYNLGKAYKDLDRANESVAAYRKALELNPQYAEAWHNLANVLRAAFLDTPQAIACSKNAVKFAPKWADARRNLGLALQEAGQRDQAVAELRETTRLDPESAQSWRDLADALYNARRDIDECIACYRNALALRPDFPEALNNFGSALKEAGQFDEALACFDRALALKPDYSATHSNRIYTILFHPDFTAADHLREARAWDARHAQPLAVSIRPHTNDPDPDRRLRIGYASRYLSDHVVGLNLLPMFRRHDHKNFEIYCYNYHPVPDATTAIFQTCADHWHHVPGQSDERLAQMIRDDKIDILVDLGLHMAGGRLLLFARKPAPVQATFAGYPGTTGVAAIDYRITDPWLDSPGEFDADYSEPSIRLPDSFWCYDPPFRQPQPNPLPALTNGFITFGCLNNFCKINGSVLDLWSQVLLKAKNSRLILQALTGQHRQRTRDHMARCHINPDRIEFVDFLPLSQYLQTYHRIDLCLDTFPYNGHTTSLDSYWMGVPVVTLIGNTIVGRAGWSQLCNLDLKELAATTPERFVDIASKLASDVPRLSQLRATLRPRLQASPIMNADRFTRGVEAAYRTMWRRWCASRR